jgi:hypothetical protein
LRLVILLCTTSGGWSSPSLLSLISMSDEVNLPCPLSSSSRGSTHPSVMPSPFPGSFPLCLLPPPVLPRRQRYVPLQNFVWLLMLL